MKLHKIKFRSYKFEFQLFLIAFIPRIILLLTVLFLVKFNLDKFLSTSDANSYLLIVENITTNSRITRPFDERAFPGWPIFVSIFKLFFEIKWVIIVLGLVLSSLVPIVFYKVTGNKNLAALICFFTPTFIIHSVNGMSEPIYLFVILLSILFFNKKEFFLSAILIGFAAIIRPTAFFPFLGMAYVLLAEKDWKSSFLFWTTSGLMVSLLLVFNYYYYEDPLRQFHSYSTLPNVNVEVLKHFNSEGQGSHFGLPLVNIIKTTFLVKPPLWKIVFIWSHVLFILLALFLGVKKNSLSNKSESIFLIWAIFNSIFILSTGEYWAFYSFDRYFIWALPAYLFLIRDIEAIKNKSKLFFVAGFLLSIVFSFFGSLKHFF